MMKSNARITDMDRSERPREKLIRYGAGQLSDTELLAVVLRTGRRGESVVSLAYKLLKGNELETVSRMDAVQLRAVPGIGEAKACELMACVEIGRRIFEKKKLHVARMLAPRDVFEALGEIRGHKKEHFVIFFLDSRNQQIHREIISVGTINASLVHPREVFEPAVKHLAVQVILAHNHPSGDLEPSEEDIAVTKRLVTAGKIIGIEVADHVIVTSTGFVSLKERGMVGGNGRYKG